MQRLLMGWAAAVVLGFAQAQAAPPSDRTPLPLRTWTQVMEAPLTTELAWSLDSQMPNPHRQTWALDRQVALSGLKGVWLGGKFRLLTDGINSVTRIYQREGCTGARADQAADAAARVWNALLASERPRLEKGLAELSSTSAQWLKLDAESVMDAWVSRLDVIWRREIQKKALQFAADRCSVFKFEIVPGGKKTEHPWARAPGKIQKNGEFSLRLNFQWIETVLNGAFTMNSDLPQSLVSSEWLLNQGVAEEFLAEPLTPHGLRIGNLPIELLEFKVVDSREEIAGTLGVDFLRRHVLTVNSGSPPHFKVWPVREFSLGDVVQWIELSEGSGGGLYSTCESRHGPTPVHWILHTPVSTKKVSRLNVQCGGVWLVGSEAAELNKSKKNKVTVDVRLPDQALGPEVTLDLPHGRLWFSGLMSAQ